MQNLILLHGALGASDMLQPLAGALSQHFNIHCYDFDGHGSRSGEKAEFSIAGFAKGLKQFITKKGLERPLVFGYSMGGYVAAALEAGSPGTFSAVATLATKWRWSEEIAAKEIRMLNPDVILEKAPKFAAALGARHGTEHWKGLLHKTAEMMTAMGAVPPIGEEQLHGLQLPCLICLGDNDKMVSMEETIAARKDIATAQLCVLPGTPHPLESVPVEVLAPILERFFNFSPGRFS